MPVNKMIEKGLFASLKYFLKTIEVSIKAPISRLAQYRELERINYSIKFIHEGAEIVKLPKASFLEVILGRGISFNRNIDYAMRPRAEVLLRKTVFELYKTGYIDKTTSIIDIGSYISDNSIVWARYLSGSGIILSIDPSLDNLTYGRKLAEINGIKNIKFVQAVCAEKNGIRLDFDGSLDHASFKKSVSEKYITSTTIDQIVFDDRAIIGFFHVDVEGFELAVLRGAERVIKRDLPVITFEQHISNEKVGDVVSYLKSFDYRIYMINEVLPGCDLDCRNFLALPPNKGTPQLSPFDQSESRKLGIFSAVVGEALIAL